MNHKILLSSIVGCLILFGVLLSSSLKAQDPFVSMEKETESSMKAPLKSGDSLEITVYRETDLSGVYEIDQVGNLNFPLVGDMQVEGLEVRELREKLIERLKTYLVYPQIDIVRGKSGGLKSTISILGHVHRPAAFKYEPGMTFLRLISQAGGFQESANRRKVRIIRNTEGVEEKIIINANDIADGKAEDILLQPGDKIFVQQATFSDEISILGHVRSPGTFNYEIGSTMMGIISRAGGFMSSANKTKVRIVRKIDNENKNIVVDVDAIIDGRADDVPIEEGDRIIVPKSTSLDVISLLGNVQSPGTYAHEPGSTLMGVITEGGGFTPTANRKKVRIVRRGGGETEVMIINAAAIINGKSEDFILEPGDMIFVPESLF